MHRPFPAGLVGRAANRHAAYPDNLELALLELSNLVRLLEPLQYYIQVFGSAATRRQYHFLDIAELVFTKEDFAFDKVGGRPERTAGDRTLRIVEQARLDVGVLDQFREAIGIETGFEQGGSQYCRIVELFWCRPHMPVDFVDIALEHAEPLSCDGAAHDGQSVDRKERVLPEARDHMAFDEARCLEARVIRFVLDAGEALGGGPIAGQFVDAAQ